MSTPDERPRPAYGEYATPEEQRARIQQPDAFHTPAPAPAPAPMAAPATTVPRVGPIDRVVTIILLAYGLYVVVTTAVELTDFPSFADMWMKTMGIPGTFTPSASAQTWAIVGIVLFSIGWLVAALLSWRAIARGRRAWWIPVVAALVSWIALAICLTIPLMADPAVVHWISTQSGQ
ncbi:DUF6264 family protein [Microbacterium sp. ASV49]|uniref:DUF6264 family protein n=1 Tax=Microbacterium candidum TaxID=3041922 RepID=A0ABT7N248_9MICO|nr:DUF6264 family protein [Microbacterium sp. ASV49]MDL9980785.1 DUF6264 family protein [Microbacterium sp. ASV49]